MADSEKTLLIKLKIAADGTPQIAAVGKGLNDVAGHASGLESRMGTLANAVRAFVGAWALKEIGGGLFSLVRSGVEFNAQMETSRLGIGALVAGLTQITDSQKGVLTGQDKWNAALLISTDLQKRARVAALETKAEYTDIIKLLQVGLGPMLSAGINDPSKIIKFTQTVAQTGGALGIPSEQMPSEIRALMRGEKGPDAQLSNIFLGDITPAKFAQLKEAGKLYDFLMEKMAAFAKAGQESQNTFDTAMSNLKDALHQALGEGTQGTTSKFTAAIKDLTASIVTFDAQGNAVFNPQFVATVEAVGEAFAKTARFTADLAMSLPEVIIQMQAVWLSMKKVAEAYKEYDPQKHPLAFAAGGGLGSLLAGYFGSGAILREGPLTPDDFVKQLMAAQTYSAPIGPRTTGEMYDAAIGPQFDPAVARLRDLTMSALAKQQKETKDTTKRKIDSLQADWSLLFSKEDRDIAAAGDPLAEALAKIEDEREQRLQKLKEQQTEFGKLMSADFFKDTEKDIKGKADEKIMQAEFTSAAKKGADWSGPWAKWTADAQQAKEITLSTHREIEDGRIGLIQNGLQRELQQKLTAHARELEDAKQKYGQNSDEYRAAVDRRQQLDDQAVDSYWHMLDEETAGTTAWARKNKELIAQQYGTIDDILRRTFLDSHNVLASATNDFLDQLASGQADLIGSLEGLASGLGKVWTKALTDILMNGGNVWKQLKGLFSFDDQVDEQGNKDYLGTLTKGAGIGSMVGGLFQTQNNYASTGGAIGGAIGAGIGMYFGGPGGAAIGTMIGSMIGTAIGAAIKKNGNHIQVSITNATLDALQGSNWSDVSTGDPGHDRKLDMGNGAFFQIEQQGLSMEAFNELQVQVRRKVREEMKGWQSILDLFPQEVKDALKDWKPTLTFSGGVEGGNEIGDTTGLQQLNDFLSNKLPKATFNAYEDGLKKAFETLGMGKERIKELFARWGELQGQELQDAVKDFTLTMLEGRNWQDTFTDKSGMGAGSKVWVEAQRPHTVMTQLDDYVSKMAVTTASMSKLTDVDDLLASQKTLNGLSRDYYGFALQAAEQLIAQFKAMRSGNDSLKESIAVSGMGDQEKLNFFYKRLGEIQSQMAGSTDPAEIASLNSQMQQYVQAALGIAPDNEENRTKLMQIIDSFNALLSGRQDTIAEEMQKRDEQVANLLEQAAQALLKAAGDLSGGNKPPETQPPPANTKPPNDGPRVRIPILNDAATAEGLVSAPNSELLAALKQAADDSRVSSIDAARQMQLELTTRLQAITDAEHQAKAQEASASAAGIADAVRAALAGMEMTGTMGDVAASIDTTDLQIAAANYTVRFIQRNPDSIASRTRG